LTLQFYNPSANNSDYFVSFQADGVEILKDMVLIQAAQSSPAVINMNFKVKIPQGTLLEATIRSSTDSATLNIIAFIQGI